MKKIILILMLTLSFSFVAFAAEGDDGTDSKDANATKIETANGENSNESKNSSIVEINGKLYKRTVYQNKGKVNGEEVLSQPLTVYDRVYKIEMVKIAYDKDGNKLPDYADVLPGSIIQYSFETIKDLEGEEIKAAKVEEYIRANFEVLGVYYSINDGDLIETEPETTLDKSLVVLAEIPAEAKKFRVVFEVKAKE